MPLAGALRKPLRDIQPIQHSLIDGEIAFVIR